MTASPAARTPGPWHVSGLHDGDPSAVYHAEGIVAEYCDPADVQFIVTACNAYDADRALIAQLTAALREISGHHMAGDWSREKARAAMAKAEQHNKDGLTTKGE